MHSPRSQFEAMRDLITSTSTLVFNQRSVYFEFYGGREALNRMRDSGTPAEEARTRLPFIADYFAAWR